jgi:hypothetical protein
MTPAARDTARHSLSVSLIWPGVVEAAEAGRGPQEEVGPGHLQRREPDRKAARRDVEDDGQGKRGLPDSRAGTNGRDGAGPEPAVEGSVEVGDAGGDYRAGALLKFGDQFIEGGVHVDLPARAGAAFGDSGDLGLGSVNDLIDVAAVLRVPEMGDLLPGADERPGDSPLLDDPRVVDRGCWGRDCGGQVVHDDGTADPP